MSTLIVRNSDKTVLESLREDFNIPLDAPCGGKGTCGKCRIRIVKGEIKKPEEHELKHLSELDIAEGYRLACHITPEEELHIDVDHHAGPVQILEDHKGFSGSIDPIIKKKHLLLDKPTLDDQRDNLSRILSALDAGDLNAPVTLLKDLPSICRDNDYNVTAVYSDEILLKVERGDTTDKHYAVACDIGTTTVVAYLLDVGNGEIIDTASDLNDQRPFGADVIARIDYARSNPDGLGTLQNKKLKQLERLIEKLLEDNRCDSDNLYSVTVAGNTTMLHLLAGADPSGIAAAPFIPGFLDGFSCRSSELGEFSIDCLFTFLPSISAYVGADIVAGVLATGMDETDELTLLVDLGTNGEIILGDRSGYVSCSTAAGPAFEGAHIRCGTGAISGAVNQISFNDGEVEYTTIGSGEAVGICGSAIVDVIAELLRCGIIDETGRLADSDELEDNPYSDHLANGSFEIIPEKSIVFTQKDIREVQLAKAAISAGIETLLHEAGKKKDDINHLYIAGGFGNYISKNSAAAMGLIPKELLGRTVSVGNTAGLGAINCALNRKNEKTCRNIVAKTRYIELSGSPFFQQKYMEEMIF